MTDWTRVTYFKPEEFASPDAPGSGSRMNPTLIAILDKIRAERGRPMIVTSGYRTPEHNAEVGGVSESEHCDGDAADIACVTSLGRWELVMAAMRHGIRRIGIGKTFVHLGVSRTLPSPRIWLY